jgi:hypothetical protein
MCDALGYFPGRSFSRANANNSDMMSFLVGGCDFGPLRLPTNGSDGDGDKHGRNQARFQPRTVDTSPMTAAMVPPISIQMALSVGDPVKNRETSEPNEFMALIPKIMSTTPPTSRAREIILFITAFQ